MSFLEIRNQPKSVDYPFTLVQLHLDKDMTKSEGKLAAFTMITFDKKKQTLELENYGTNPFGWPISSSKRNRPWCRESSAPSKGAGLHQEGTPE